MRDRWCTNSFFVVQWNTKTKFIIPALKYLSYETVWKLYEFLQKKTGDISGIFFQDCSQVADQMFTLIFQTSIFKIKHVYVVTPTFSKHLCAKLKMYYL